jgi:hypothetical protein
MQTDVVMRLHRYPDSPAHHPHVGNYSSNPRSGGKIRPNRHKNLCRPSSARIRRPPPDRSPTDRAGNFFPGTDAHAGARVVQIRPATEPAQSKTVERPLSTALPPSVFSTASTVSTNLPPRFHRCKMGLPPRFHRFHLFAAHCFPPFHRVSRDTGNGGSWVGRGGKAAVQSPPAHRQTSRFSQAATTFAESTFRPERPRAFLKPRRRSPKALSDLKSLVRRSVRNAQFYFTPPQ